MHAKEPNDYMTRAQRANMEKGTIVSEVPTWAEGMYETPSKSVVDSQSAKPRLKDKYSRSFRTISEARLDKRLRTEKKAIEKATFETPTASSSASDTAANDEKRHTNKSKEKRKKVSKIAPLQMPPVTDTSDVASSSSGEEKPSPKALIRELDVESIVKDSGSGPTSSSDDLPEETVLKKTFQRPKSAKGPRASLFKTGSDDHNMERVPTIWNPYLAGDRVASFWRNNQHDNYPAPASPTFDGIVNNSL
ncbi:unnamed protein product [Caenorhabditis bovis]|uniref:Uncharacterized protein n=1 Tax=Caenorhabditis bovis TaxID=2654633 RepID=A0A8S1EJD7_9PELO|nr:unnamed protein product [Caenorhabditis bovis]